MQYITLKINVQVYRIDILVQRNKRLGWIQSKLLSFMFLYIFPSKHFPQFTIFLRLTVCPAWIVIYIANSILYTKHTHENSPEMTFTICLVAVTFEMPNVFRSLVFYYLHLVYYRSTRHLQRSHPRHVGSSVYSKLYMVLHYTN